MRVRPGCAASSGRLSGRRGAGWIRCARCAPRPARARRCARPPAVRPCCAPTPASGPRSRSRWRRPPRGRARAAPGRRGAADAAGAPAAQREAGRLQPEDLAAHAAHRQLRPRAGAAHVEHPVEATRAPAAGAAGAGLDGLDRRRPVPVRAGARRPPAPAWPARCGCGLRAQQPGLRAGRTEGSSSRADRSAVSGSASWPAGILLRQQVQHAAGGAGVLAVRHQQAAVAARTPPAPAAGAGWRGHSSMERRPQRNTRSSAHSSSATGLSMPAAVQPAAPRASARGGVEHVHGVAGARAAEREQAAQQAGAGDADAQGARPVMRGPQRGMRPAGAQRRGRCLAAALRERLLQRGHHARLGRPRGRAARRRRRRPRAPPAAPARRRGCRRWP
jgi:hypothetical protein